MFKIIQPETLLKWQKRLIKKFWTFKTDIRKPGRPPTPKNIRELVLQIKNENVLWGCRKISNELKKIGIQIFRIIKKYIKYYNTKRPHQGIEGKVPKGCNIQSKWRIKSENILFGLHHHYYRETA